MKRFYEFPFLYGALVAVCIAACVSGPTANQSAGITLATEVATVAAIEYQLEDVGAKTVRAQAFENAAKSIQAVTASGPVTLPVLAQALQPAIAKLPAGDQLAANTLVLAIKPWVDQQLNNPKVVNAQATVDVFLKAVIAACAVYTGS